MTKIYYCVGIEPLHVLVSILSKCVQQHLTVLLCVPYDHIKSIDSALWDSPVFLPHGTQKDDVIQLISFPSPTSPTSPTDPSDPTTSVLQDMLIYYQRQTNDTDSIKSDKKQTIYIGRSIPVVPKPYELYTYTENKIWNKHMVE